MADDRHPFSDPEIEQLLRQMPQILHKRARRMLAGSARDKYTWADPAVTLDDLVQEAGRRILGGVPGFRGSTAADFRGWMYEILKKVMVDNARRSCARSPGRRAPPGPDPARLMNLD